MATKYKKVTKADGTEYFREQFTLNGNKYDVTAKTEALLEKKIDDIKYKIRSGDTINSPNITVATWAYEWLETYKKPVVVEKSYKQYKTNINKYIIPEIGNMKLVDVQQIHLQKILVSQTGKSFSHVSHIRCAITGMFSKALSNNFIKKNPAKELIMPKTTKGSHRCLTDDEINCLLKVCKTYSYGIFALIMYYCGLRLSECSALQRCDIDLKNKILHVTKAIESGNNNVKSPKTEAGVRDIPIPDEFIEYLIIILRDKNPDDYVITNSNGKICNGVYLGKRWKNIVRLMDIEMGAKVKRNKIIESKIAKDLTPFCLRHTFCTNLQRAGVPINVAKYLMGHEDLNMIAKIYAHQTEDQTENARKLMNKYIKSKNNI